jgi:cell division septum initiation protein DivIVA
MSKPYISIEELEELRLINEQEIIELLDLNKDLLRRIQDLEKDINHYRDRVKEIESIKVEEVASKSVWKTIAVASAAIGALVMSLFKDDDK